MSTITSKVKSEKPFCINAFKSPKAAVEEAESFSNDLTTLSIELPKSLTLTIPGSLTTMEI